MPTEGEQFVQEGGSICAEGGNNLRNKGEQFVPQSYHISQTNLKSQSHIDEAP